MNNNNYGIPSSIVPDREHEGKKESLLFENNKVTCKYFCGIDPIQPTELGYSKGETSYGIMITKEDGSTEIKYFKDYE